MTGNTADPSVILPIPSYNRLVAPLESLNNTSWQRVMILLKEPSNTDHIKKVVTEVKATFSP